MWGIWVMNIWTNLLKLILVCTNSVKNYWQVACVYCVRLNKGIIGHLSSRENCSAYFMYRLYFRGGGTALKCNHYLHTMCQPSDPLLCSHYTIPWWIFFFTCHTQTLFKVKNCHPKTHFFLIGPNLIFRKFFIRTQWPQFCQNLRKISKFQGLHTNLTTTLLQCPEWTAVYRDLRFASMH